MSSVTPAQQSYELQNITPRRGQIAGANDTDTSNNQQREDTQQTSDNRRAPNDRDSLDDHEQEEEDSSQPPDGGWHAWGCVGACFLINAFTWGIATSYGVYLTHYLDTNIFPKAKSIHFAVIGGLNFSVAMLASPVVTWFTREYGIHTSMMLGIALQFVGYSTASVSKKIWQLSLSQGVSIGLSTGFLFIPSTAIVPQWFTRKRSLASGIAASGTGAGGALFAWATGAMIKNLSLEKALFITAGMGAAANIVALLLIRDRNQEVRPTQRAFDRRLLRKLDVWLLLSWAFISIFGYIVVLFSIGDFATAIGLTHEKSVNIVGFLNVGMAVGRPVIGIGSDRYDRITVAAILTILCGISCFAFWISVTSYGWTVVFAIWIGAILGVFWMVSPQNFTEHRNHFADDFANHCTSVRRGRRPTGLTVLAVTLVAQHRHPYDRYVPPYRQKRPLLTLRHSVAEIIALKLRRYGESHPYLGTQIFAGATYLFAGAILSVLALRKRRQRRAAIGERDVA